MPAWLLTERHNLHTGEGCLLNTPHHMHAKCPSMPNAACRPRIYRLPLPPASSAVRGRQLPPVQRWLQL